MTAVLYVGVHDVDYPRNRRIRQYLLEHGHSVSVVEKPRGGLAARLVGTLQALRASEQRHDVVVVSEFALTLVPLVWLVTRLRRQRLVVDGFVSLYETHVEDWSTFRPTSWRARLLRAADHVAYRCADLFLVDTDVRRQALVARHAGRTVVVTLPVGAPAWAEEQPPAPSDGVLRVLYYGNYIPLHGLDVVIDAVADAAARTELHLTLVGDGRGRAEVVADVAARGIADRCTFLGPVPEPELAAVIREHHVVLGVFGGSTKAGSVIANKVWQALACGRAVVTRESAALDEVRTAVGDQLVTTRPGSAGSLAEALVRVATGLEARGDAHVPVAAADPVAATAAVAVGAPAASSTSAALARYVDQRFTQLGTWLDAGGAARRSRTR